MLAMMILERLPAERGGWRGTSVAVLIAIYRLLKRVVI